MTFAERLSRKAGMRNMVAALFVPTALASLGILIALEASTMVTVCIPLLVALTAVPVVLVRSQTIDRRWFHLLPIAITVLAGIAIWSVTPDPGPMAIPIIFNGSLVGFLMPTIRAATAHLTFSSAVMFSPIVAGMSTLPSTLTILVSMGVLWGIAITTRAIWRYAEEAAAQLDELAQSDPLTEIGNRRLIDERLDDELQRSVRIGDPVALVVLDLNGFKEINDDLGHTAGDDMLRGVALAISGAVRAHDTPGRVGGDEFCVIAPHTPRGGAVALTEHLRSAIEGVSIAGRGVGVAIGVAVAPEDGTTARELFDVADAEQRADKPRLFVGDEYDPRASVVQSRGPMTEEPGAHDR